MKSSFVFLFVALCLPSELYGHGEYRGFKSESYTFLDCDCGDSRTTLRVVREEWYYVAPINPVKELSPGRHVHRTKRRDCVDRNHLAYRAQCNDYGTVCTEKMVDIMPYYASCGDGASLGTMYCHIKAQRVKG